MKELFDILKKLISFESITPHDAACQTFMMDYLEKLGISSERFDAPPVSNFLATIGTGKPFVLLAGHSDVVPPGDLSKWDTPPFSMTTQKDYLFGRGVADMKGALAAMLAVMKAIKEENTFKGTLGLLVTSGEEGDHYDLGTPYVMEHLKQRNLIPDYCIVGEPSSQNTFGDMIKIGRRGSLSAKCILKGKQGHVAYPHLAKNPIHLFLPALTALSKKVWDEGNEYFPPTSFQFTYLEAGKNNSGNMIPETLEAHFNIRFSTEQTAPLLQEEIERIFQENRITPHIEWRLSGNPFLTEKGKLLDVTQAVLEEKIGQQPILSTSGGTSDARFIAPYGTEVIELGLVGKTIHKTNECIQSSDLLKLQEIYFDIVKRIMYNIYPV